MKKWYNWNEIFIKIKITLIIYLIGSLIAWNFNIGEWWLVGVSCIYAVIASSGLLTIKF